MLKKLHARLGDFWWYSLMLFCACRAADKHMSTHVNAEP